MLVLAANFSKKNSKHFHNSHHLKNKKMSVNSSHITASIQSKQTEARMCHYSFNQFIHSAVLERSPSLKQVLLQLLAE